LRKSVEEHLFHWHDQTLRLTVSIGVSNGQVLSGSLTEALINYSLRRMSIFIVPKSGAKLLQYASVANGRNIKIFGFLTAECLFDRRICNVIRQNDSDKLLNYLLQIFIVNTITEYMYRK
jgi:hypothetical protein